MKQIFRMMMMAAMGVAMMGLVSCSKDDVDNENQQGGNSTPVEEPTYETLVGTEWEGTFLGVHPGYGLLLNEEHLGFTRKGGQRQVWVSPCDTVDSPWTVSSNDGWVHVVVPTAGSPSTSTGVLAVEVSVEENNMGAERRGTVTFVQGSLSATLTVAQEAYDPATNYCPLTVLMENTHNEPWAGDAYLSFESLSGTVEITMSGTMLDIAAAEAGNPTTIPFSATMSGYYQTGSTPTGM